MDSIIKAVTDFGVVSLCGFDVERFFREFHGFGRELGQCGNTEAALLLVREDLLVDSLFFSREP